MTWPESPVIYEVNTAVWLGDLSRSAGRRVTFEEVTAEAWEAVTPAGTDAVWLMGVWERSPVGLVVAQGNADLVASFRAALPDLADDDVIGSPYCIRGYQVDPRFGGPAGLAAARAALVARGRRLVLDYVPNHVAPDHPWVRQHPERLIRGSADDVAADPGAWMQAGSSIIAHGRDPYFPPWPDVVQLNAFSPELREASAETLAGIAEQCDGIRCDMAMLVTNNVFAKTWGTWSGTEPAEEFWPAVIGSLREHHPNTVLLAEAYWDMEWELQQQGFDFCYDKRLYDRLLSGDVASARDHLRADLAYQSRLVRFLENHDEPRIASVVADATVEQAAAVVVATLPGATLWHEGQFEGRRVRPPVFLQRRPVEAPDRALNTWYEDLLAIVDGVSLRSGNWQLVEATGWPDNESCRNLLAWIWDSGATGRRHLVVVNWSAEPATGRLPLPWTDLRGGARLLTDVLHSDTFERDGDELTDPGLYVALDPWHFH